MKPNHQERMSINAALLAAAQLRFALNMKREAVLNERGSVSYPFRWSELDDAFSTITESLANSDFNVRSALEAWDVVKQCMDMDSEGVFGKDDSIFGIIFAADECFLTMVYICGIPCADPSGEGKHTNKPTLGITETKFRPACSMNAE